jgi:hypothetical protein
MDLCLQKSNVIKKHKAFKDVMPQEALRKNGNYEIHTEEYHLVASDLRDLKQLEKALKSAGVDFSVPILYLSECVMVYMAIDESAVKLFASHFFLSISLGINLLDSRTKQKGWRSCDVCDL